MLATVEVLIPSSPFGLPSSSTVGFDIVTKKVDGLIVPDQAVVKGIQGHVVYRVENGAIKIVPVKLAGSGSGKAAIICDLPSGEQLAVAQENKLLALSDGCRVTVVGVGGSPASQSVPSSPTSTSLPPIPGTGAKP